MSKKINFNDAPLVWDLWEEHAQERPQSEAIIHWDVLEEPFRWTYEHLLEESLKIAGYLLSRGVKPGDVCALIMRHHKYFYPFYMGIVAMGAIPAVLAYPNARLHPDKFLHGLSGMAQKSGLDWVLTERDLEIIIAPLILNEQSSVKGFFSPLEWVHNPQEEKPDHVLIKKNRAAINSASPFLLQHSSGTTGLQKAVTLSHQAVLDHVERYAESIGLTTRDKIISWLPLYHDMGLIAAFHMPLAFGIPSIQIDAFQWLSAPAIFFQIISKERATLTWLPNFSYDFMAARVSEEDMAEVDASSLRMLINCSEVVRAESHEKFFNRFGEYGIKKESLAACYAMAETAFAVTQTPLGSGAVSLVVDRSALAEGKVVPAQSESSKKVCLSSGKTIRDCLVKILDTDGVLLPEDRVGAIAIKSASLFDGYRKNPEKTREVLRDGWYLSGDRGFLHGGEYYIIGRGDDVIISAGRNIFPEDIEEVVNQVKDLIPGRIVAFGMVDQETGTESVCVVAETSLEDKEKRNTLVLAIKQAGMAIDVTIAKVCLAPPRSLVKSSAGKISRKMNRERIMSGECLSGGSK